MGGRISVEHIICLTLLLIAVFEDLRSRKISNRLSLIAFIIALVSIGYLQNLSYIWTALASFGTALVLMLPLYHFKILGGGDAKLMIAISPLLDWESLVGMLLFSFIWGAILGVILAVVNRRARVMAGNLLGILNRQKPAPNQLQYLPFSVALLLGLLSQLSLVLNGGHWL